MGIRHVDHEERIQEELSVIQLNCVYEDILDTALLETPRHLLVASKMLFSCFVTDAFLYVYAESSPRRQKSLKW